MDKDKGKESKCLAKNVKFIRNKNTQTNSG